MRRYAFFLFLIASLSCSSPSSTGPGSTNPPPTNTDPISYQTRQTHSFQNGTIFFSNEFPGARLNGISETSPMNYRVIIDPENIPINDSPWYAFKVWSQSAQTVEVTLSYRDGDHRYYPKLSTDLENWERIDPTDLRTDPLANTATLSLDIGTDTLWVAGQELITTGTMREWMQGLAQNDFVTLETIGTSMKGRNITAVEITEAPGAPRHILIVGRQHPPEVTGAIALMAFMERLSEDDDLARGFRQRYVVSAVPVVNPDGVDEGHWRHNTNGVDLNRDWVDFEQKETQVVRDYFLRETQQGSDAVHFAVDFHSTWSDLFYPILKSMTTNPPGLLWDWFDALDEHFPGENLVIQPSGTTLPTTKAFFYPTFGCPTVIYEVGDNTDRAYVREKARYAATALMQLLLDL